jgi:hypothetical protein
MKHINLINEIINKYDNTKTLYNSFINETPSPCIEFKNFIPTQMVLDMKSEMDTSYQTNSNNVRTFDRADSHMAELWELSQSPIANGLKNELQIKCDLLEEQVSSVPKEDITLNKKIYNELLNVHR